MGNRSFLAAWSAFALVFFGCSSCGEKRMPASRTEAFAENGRRSLTLIFTGDLMQHMPQVFAARQRDGSFDYTSCFSRLNNYFSSADFVIANLETTLGEEPYSGYPRFRSPEALAGAMRRAGVDVAVLANNHICDRGAEGIRSTLAALDEAGLLHTGAFADSVPPRERHPLMLEKGAFRVALLNYTYGTNGLPVPSGCRVNGIDTAAIRREIASARQDGATHVALFVHWGNEYERLPGPRQRELAAAFHRWGADLVIGSHPHVVQPAETIEDSAGNVRGATVYSMGNFVSNQRFPDTDGGLSVRVTLTLDEQGRTSCLPEYLIVWTCVSRDPNSRPPLRYRAELLARNDRARASRRLRPVRRAYAPAHGASRPGLYGNTLRLLMRRFLRNDGHGMRAAVFVFGEGGASPPLEEPADDRMLIIRAFRRTISLRTSAEKRKFSVIFVTVN